MAPVLSKPRGRKRTRNEEGWKENIRKIRKNKVFKNLYENSTN